MSVQARDDTSTVTIRREGEWIVAADDTTDVTSQGRTVSEALYNLAEALELYEEPLPDDADIGEPDTPWFSE